ncbi:MAG: carboxylating nicotinate-nucleotide diphosphorylase [Bacteroidota bacterium]|jgi:nicotinate-nucleotide pyrophosphorylase (carboxylating)
MRPDYDWEQFIRLSLEEDVRNGDHSALSCIPAVADGHARLNIKQEGIIAGIELAGMITKQFDPSLQFQPLVQDGDRVQKGQIGFELRGRARSILTTERLILNCLQRMSGVATLTAQFVDALKGSPTQILDTRKTTPLFRAVEKWAVCIGGGHNHRFGLFDMIMIKDNHIDYAGGIRQAIQKANAYLRVHQLSLKIEIETRNLDELREVLSIGAVQRIMLDNYTPDDIRKAVQLINHKYETEISGGVTLDNIGQYADCGADYISVGAITHSYRSLDMSLKAIR